MLKDFELVKNVLQPKSGIGVLFFTPENKMMFVFRESIDQYDRNDIKPMIPVNLVDILKEMILHPYWMHKIFTVKNAEGLLINFFRKNYFPQYVEGDIVKRRKQTGITWTVVLNDLLGNIILKMNHERGISITETQQNIYKDLKWKLIIAFRKIHLPYFIAKNYPANTYEVKPNDIIQNKRIWGMPLTVTKIDYTDNNAMVIAYNISFRTDCYNLRDSSFKADEIFPYNVQTLTSWLRRKDKNMKMDLKPMRK